MDRYKRKPIRTCKICKVEQPVEQFGSFACGKPHTSCLTCHRPHERRGQGPHEVQQPCASCGRTFYRRGFWSHVQTIKHCSEECRTLARACELRQCQRCKVTKPRAEFAISDCSKRKTSNQCKICLIDRDEHPGIKGLSPRPTALSMFLTAQSRASKVGQAFDLTKVDAKKLHRGSCACCGRKVSVLRIKDARRPWTRDNVRGLCRRCNKIQRWMSHPELLLLAHEIALRNPLDLEVAADGQKKKRRQGYP